MIAVDSSALIAILEREPDASHFADEIRKANRLLISAVNAHEAAIVLRIRRGANALARFWRFLQIENDFEIVPFDEAQAREAVAAFERYGKGINSETRLNLADCAAYALAKTMNVPLQFKGDDFVRTDLHFVGR
ncbi:ribonuclease VapC [Rhodopseudomonas thermotolerans]|uniref:Ribonuclease VapC n=2 Tax=Rhodopseudomonas TaxID=1073 RepID=A0A336JWU9_9BRAD|nr:MULTISPECIES: type II toxin-antitoxin system VapC family toxin [Rhodopseudomonas]RED25561.1 ribonuclease VapC [Rhodopseudomonas pentothenatexigens]REF90391.1 ribonuclease VapC [Rhodopseudomonas thermotolerans]SSW93173.1 ribonuclease VapC [Rhodopseudomonas pentothenatexigens]